MLLLRSLCLKYNIIIIIIIMNFKILGISNNYELSKQKISLESKKIIIN